MANIKVQDTQPELHVNAKKLAAMSALVDRVLLAKDLGQSYGGDRDVYETLGYPLDPTFDQYYARYKRQDVAGRVVDLPAIDTWRRAPVIIDNGTRSDDDEPGTPFVQALRQVADDLRLWHYLQRVDRLSGIGRFGVLLIGTRGAGLETELGKGSLKSTSDILYLAAYSEASATVNQFVLDEQDRRFGLPENYKVAIADGKTVLVHWTRVIHVAEDLLEDEVYGRPRLERIYNRLEDLTKIVGGGSEAAWRVMDRGLHVDVRDGFESNDQTEADLQDEVDNYIHGLQRFIRTTGADVKTLGSDEVNPAGLFDIIMSLIAGAADIPKRILLGSERGELASSQDMASWSGRIAARQTQFAEPTILRPFIDRLVYAGALPEPKGGKYTVEWPSLFELSDLERADLADKLSSAIQKIAPAGATDLVVDPDEFRERVLGWPRREITPDQVLDEEDNAEEDSAA